MLEDSYPRITQQFLNKLLRSDIKNYYSTRYLNDKLYLHYKGFKQIENLEEFTGLKVLYIEGNAIEVISGLENCKELRCLYLHENCVREISGLETLSELKILNLSDNLITTVSNLQSNKTLETLNLQRNRIGTNGLDDVIHLAELHSITVLDLSHNKIEDPQILPEVLQKIPNLAVLYLQGNPVCKKIQNYRKTLVNQLPSLKFLDDRPVTPEEKRFAEAFVRGGIQAEREERRKWQEEREQERLRQHRAFREMIESHRNRDPHSGDSTLGTEGSSDEWNSTSRSETPEVSYIGYTSSEKEESHTSSCDEHSQKEEEIPYLEAPKEPQETSEEVVQETPSKFLIENTEEEILDESEHQERPFQEQAVQNKIEEIVAKQQEELDELD
mmetsp:Transcript_12190/g.17754  ORF Transcript_12190/g.17754 Transcript_12190/m.17754 type:complete len:386 (+) Transcript_12190:34-1191(+)